MKSSDCCPNNGGNGVVVLGVVDGPDNGFLGIVAVLHQYVEHAGHRLHQVGAGVPGPAGLQNGQALLMGFGHTLLHESPQRSPVLTRPLTTSRLVVGVTFQIPGYTCVALEPPDGIRWGVHPEQTPEHVDKGDTGGEGSAVVVGDRRGQNDIGPEIRRGALQVRDQHGGYAHEGSIARRRLSALVPGLLLVLAGMEERPDGTPDPVDLPRRAELVRNMLRVKAPIFDHLLKGPESELCIVRGAVSYTHLRLPTIYSV